MADEYEVYEKGRKVVLEELDKLFSKGTLSPAETEAAKCAVCLLKEMDEEFGGGEMDEGYSERRGGRMSRRSYSMDGRSYDGMMYDDGRVPFREYAITSYDGRGGNRGGGGRNSNRSSMASSRREGTSRYSGHSINDRMVECLEKLMDSAESDYEASKVKEMIHFIRDDEMNG